MAYHIPDPVEASTFVAIRLPGLYKVELDRESQPPRLNDQGPLDSNIFILILYLPAIFRKA